MKLSVIIPVFNKWELTGNCLKSLAEHTLPDLSAEDFEVLLVDNASTDATPHASPALGQRLFGDRFRYLRQPVNRNFAGACNLGAVQARGEFLFFLNNDTLLTPGWLPPLLEMFRREPDLGACGPLLLYPELFGRKDRVQHAGVYITPAQRVGHLYKGFPASHPAVQKKRELQLITAAALLIPSAIYREMQGFEEGFVNGFEDVDLCLRMGEKGYRLMVQPASVIYHLESQSTGRHDQETDNSRLLRERVGHLLKPDQHLLAAADGLHLGISPWLSYVMEHSSEEARALARYGAQTPAPVLQRLLDEFPLWHDGYHLLADSLLQQGDLPGAMDTYQLSRLHSAPPPRQLRFCTLLVQTGNTEAATQVLKELFNSIYTFPGYCGTLATMRGSFAAQGLEVLERRCDAVLAGAPRFFSECMHPYIRALRETFLAAQAMDTCGALYRAWVELPEGEAAFRRRWLARAAPADSAAERTTAPPVRISVLMPVYNPAHAHLEEAIVSVRNQTYSHWELCLADDASTDAAILPILRRHAEEDSRIKLVCREKNGHISASSNSALALATGEFCALMDQDDTLPFYALEAVAAAIRQRPDAAVLFSDEDKTEETDTRFQPHCKWGYDPELFLQQNCISHLGVYSTDLLREIGGFRQGLEGSQDYDLALRCIEKCGESRVVHIPLALYHWRNHEGSTSAGIKAKSYAVSAFSRALREHCERTGKQAAAELAPYSNYFRLRHTIPAGAHLGLVFATGAHSLLSPEPIRLLAESAQKRVRSLTLVAPASACDLLLREGLGKGLPPLKILTLESLGDGSLQSLLARGIQRALSEAKGHVLGILEPGMMPFAASVEPDWAGEILGQALRPETGCVGATVCTAEGDIVQSGRVVTADGRLHNIYQGTGRTERSHFWRHNLVHTAVTLSPCGLFAARERWEQAGPWPENMDLWGAAHTCLTLHEQGLHNICTPYAVFGLPEGASVNSLTETAASTSPADASETAFYQCWGETLQRHPIRHPALMPVERGFVPVWEAQTATVEPA